MKMRIFKIKLQKSTLIALGLALLLFALSGFGRNVFAAEKVTICHKGAKTATVAAPAVSAHRAHGDSLGACGATPPPYEDMVAVVMMQCGPEDGSIEVMAVSSSPSPAIEGGIERGDDCAEVLAALLDADYRLKSVTTGSAGDDSLKLVTDYLLLGRIGDDDDDFDIDD
jgi:hypothetical protein